MLLVIVFSWSLICCHSFPQYFFHISQNFCYLIFYPHARFMEVLIYKHRCFNPPLEWQCDMIPPVQWKIMTCFSDLSSHTTLSLLFRQKHTCFPFAVSFLKDSSSLIFLLCITVLLRLLSRHLHLGCYDYHEPRSVW